MRRRSSMKFKMIALFLALSLSAWAQSATTPNATPQDEPKAGCSDCCKHTAGDKDKDTKGCCHEMKAAADGKMSCCEGKDGKGCMGKDGMSCMKGEKSEASCGKGKCCDMK